jgi:prepilin-type processing-associated H-X9-DG protein
MPGRTNNNQIGTAQGNLRNDTVRPLNHYGLTEGAVTCPMVHRTPLDQTTYDLFEWVGNSYIFNCLGLPPFQPGHGLDGLCANRLTNLTQTVVFGCGVLSYPTTETKGWHRTTPAGNILFADNHVGFTNIATKLTNGDHLLKALKSLGCRLDENGQVQMIVRGVKGGGCLALTKKLEAALGNQVVSRQMPPEANESCPQVIGERRQQQTESSTIAASSIQGTGAQNLASARRKGCTAVSGTAFGPNCSSRRRASSLVRPVGSGESFTLFHV